MANLKTKKTAAGAQQYSAKGKARALTDTINKDIKLFIDRKLTAKEFKDKYGVSVAKAQAMAYGAEAAERESNSFEREMARTSKKLGTAKRQGYSYGGMAKKKMGYKDGGLACGASNPAARPMKKSK